MNAHPSTTPLHLPRRDFIRLVATAAAGIAVTRESSAQAPAHANVPLGVDPYCLRAMRWNAEQVIAYAAEQGLDAVLFNTLRSFESLESGYLHRLKETAARLSLRLYVGVGSVAEGSTTFRRDYGSAEDLLALGVRVASAVGSPVVNCRIGALPDRSTEGGIEARIAELVKVLRSVRNRAQDAGVRFAVENHAGDLRSDELLRLIEAAGTEITGVMLDPGNAVWAMEDPMRQIEMLGRHVLCTSVRDWMVWETPEGATFQWTAIGEGLMDVPAFVRHMAKLCPGVPLVIETISNSPRTIPFLTPDHWKIYPAVPAAGIADFLALCRRGRPLELARPPAGTDARAFEQQFQRDEFERSVAYLRRHCPVGRGA